MILSNPLVMTSIFFGLLALIFFILTVLALKERKMFGTARNFVIALLMLALSALSGTISIAVQGYTALTREDLAAIVKVEPIGKQRFMARFSLPDGGSKTFSLAGDQLYVDAHILKWKPWANFFGLHTSYELDRVAGRYDILGDETAKAHTVYSLSRERPIDIFDLRRKFAFLNPLLDVEYGSAAFISSNTTQEFKVMVSTTGLLIRKNEK